MVSAEWKDPVHMPPHLHEAIEIVYVTDGCIELGVGQELYHMEKGDFAIVFPNVIHHYQVFLPFPSLWMRRQFWRERISSPSFGKSTFPWQRAALTVVVLPGILLYAIMEEQVQTAMASSGIKG